MALPGIFAPVALNGRVLVDGGMVNPVPYDLLVGECDITIAIDVIGSASPDAHSQPSFFETIFNSVHIMQQAIITEKMKHQRPDIYIKPALTGIRMLDFFEVDTIYKRAKSAKHQSKRELARMLN